MSLFTFEGLNCIYFKCLCGYHGRPNYKHVWIKVIKFCLRNKKLPLLSECQMTVHCKMF